MIYYEIIRYGSGCFCRLEKIDTQYFYVLPLTMKTAPGYYSVKRKEHTHIQVALKNHVILCSFECLIKEEPGDIKFLLTLLKLMAERRKQEMWALSAV